MTVVGVGVGPGFSRGRRPAFVPTDVDDLLQWYDETSWAVSAGDVTAWNDHGANSRDMSPTGGVTINATGGPNGEPCIEFDGTSGYLQATYSENARNVVYLVCRPQAVAAANETLIDGPAGLNKRRIYTASTSNLGMYQDVALTTAGDHDAWQLIEADFNGASSSLRFNDASAAEGSSGTVKETGGLRVGAGGGASPGWFIDMLTVELVIAAAPDSRVREYLNDKWSIF